MTTLPASERLADALRDIVGDKNVYLEDKVRKVFSADAYYFSPVLQEALGDKIADVIVAPGSQAELQALIRYAVQQGIPLTLRGAGTGNYGQAVPLEAGIVVLTRRLNHILSFDADSGQAIVEPGTVMGAIERLGREQGWELPCYPSTYATATIGGFVAGGFGGVGSIRNGTLWDGMVLAAELVNVDAEAEAHWLEGKDLLSVIHAYGTTGIISRLRLQLTPALPWEESVFSFADFDSALRFAYQLCQDTSIDKRLVTINQAPIPNFFKPLVRDGGVREGRSGVLLELAAGQREAALELAASYGGSCDWQRDAALYHKSNFSLSDFTWNHTTLWALKEDPRYTYLQVMYKPDIEDCLEQIHSIQAQFPEEVFFHNEYVRMHGQLTASGLPLVYYRDKDRLYQIIQAFEDLGAEIADPHTWLLDKDPRWNGDPVLRAKAERNPHNLLNPGKLSMS